MTFKKTKETLYLEAGTYLLACFAIAYLLARHSLLVNNKLKADEFQCGDCTKACFGVVVSKPSLARISTNESDSWDATGSVHLKVISWATFGCLLFYWCYCIDSLVCYASHSLLGILPFHWCVIAAPLGGFSYQSAKCCMYLVFVGRLHQGFEGSAYARSKRTIHGLYAVICVFTLAMDVYWLAFARGVEGVENGAHYCSTNVSGVMLGIVASFDLIFTGTVVYLFNNALRKMMGEFTARLDERGRAEDRQRNESLYLMPLKYTVLSTVAVLTTLLMAVVFSVSNATGFVLPIDSVVNCSALIFMTTYWEPTYDWICSPLVSCLANTPFLPCAALAQPKIVERMSPTVMTLDTVVSETVSKC